MQRAFSIALSIAAVVLSALLAFKSAPGMAGVTGGSSAPVRDAGTPSDAAAGSAGDLTLDAAPPSAPEAVAVPGPDAPDADFHLADGTLVPALGRGAPAHVRFGVILVTYEGAEGAPEKGARHRAEALSIATHLVEDARGNFHGAVERGDNGSSDDVGAVTRGVLEPGSEAVLFALPVGEVSGVIDTPRGFWIVKRLE
jgi:hypothetical protein